MHEEAEVVGTSWKQQLLLCTSDRTGWDFVYRGTLKRLQGCFSIEGLIEETMLVCLFFLCLFSQSGADPVLCGLDP